MTRDQVNRDLFCRQIPVLEIVEKVALVTNSLVHFWEVKSNTVFSAHFFFDSLVIKCWGGFVLVGLSPLLSYSSFLCYSLPTFCNKFADSRRFEDFPFFLLSSFVTGPHLQLAYTTHKTLDKSEKRGLSSKYLQNP